ncbi:hypothetical protein V1L52_04950 [Treponema sp. HNW]|uniref:hypothetical protein n=1 Tax=Treponema sp. HNW TaxID=3116654 RepID=UPI003D09678A
MRKSFDNLTIADDFMFCTVMEDPILCKELLTMLLKLFKVGGSNSAAHFNESLPAGKLSYKQV